ncbi:MAG TPA: dockerin type I domain-containing protein [Tepidisphaeraceae bacterium]|jgi:autotransporter-associated beta strand protein|nr:dockerin type I domain-containing protein [Tepidisphaeraceae bacterium]
MHTNRWSKTSSIRMSLLIAAASSVAVGFVSPALASVPPPTTRPTDWNNAGGDNAYVNPANWNPALTSAPANADNEFLTINNGGTAVINPGDNAEGAFINLGLRPGDTGTLLITGGTLTTGELRVGGRETIATDLTDWSAGTTGNGGGTGSVVQSGNSVVNVNFTFGNDPNTGANYEPPVQSMYVGDSGLVSGNTANGSYLIKDNAVLLNGLQTNDQLVIGSGPGAQGAFTQQDNSSVTSTGTVIVGRRGATGSYSISGGTLSATANSLYIGDGDTNIVAAGTVGVFTQTGGTVNAKEVDVGRRGGNGDYSLSAGTLNLSGPLNIAGTANSTDPAFINPVGIFSLGGTGVVTTSTLTTVSIAINGASSTYSATPTASGTFAMTGGSMTLNNIGFFIGSGSGATGTVNVSGGTLLNATGVNTEIDVGSSGGNGAFNLSNTGSIRSFNFYVGGNATAIGNNAAFNMTGGTFTTTNLVLSATALANASSLRTLNISGGTVSAVTFNQGTLSSTSVTRSATISGGSFTVTGTTTGGKNVTYNLSGGTSNFQGVFNLDNSSLNISNLANVTFSNFNNAANMGGATTISGGTVNVTGVWRINNNATTPPGSLTISGGNVTMASLITGGTAVPLNISGGSLSIPSLTLSTGTIFTTDNAISLSSAITLGSTTTGTVSTTINVDSGSLALTGPISNTLVSTLNKTGPGILTLSGTQTHTAAATYTVSAGTLNLNISGGSNATVNANGGSTNFGSSQTLAAVNVANGATAALVAAGTHTLTTPALNLGTSGTLDLANNSLIIPYTGSSPLAMIRGYLQAGYNNGAWNGTGIDSSTANARADHATGIAYVDTGSQIQTTYTWMGDLNLDGKLNADDYALLDRQVAKFGLGSAATWTTGDLNYDGVVTSADYMIIDTAFGQQSGSLSPEFLAEREAEFGPGYVAQLVAAVPEPGSILLLFTIAPFITARRRRDR